MFGEEKVKKKQKQPNKTHNESKDKTCLMYICREKKTPIRCILYSWQHIPTPLMASKEK